MSSYKDIISELGLPDDLCKRLEDLLNTEKQKEKAGLGTHHPGFKDLNQARKQFRKAYRKIRKHDPNKEKDTNEDFFDSDIEEAVSDSSGSFDSSQYDSDSQNLDPGAMLDYLPKGVLTDAQKEGVRKGNEKLKSLEAEYLRKRTQLEKAMKDMEEDNKMDINLLKTLANELNDGEDAVDFGAENDELDRIINELKEATKDFDPMDESGVKIEEVVD